MSKLKIALSSFMLVAFASFAIGQGSGFFPNWPLVSGDSYCAVTTNGSCTQTIPAGPTVVTGNETFPANTSLGNRSPANVLVPIASLNALPITVSDFSGGTTGTTAVRISASDISGGVLIISQGTINTANVSLPLTPIDGQQYRISSAVTLTNLLVKVYPTSTAIIISAPTVLTPSTTGAYAYNFMYNSSGNKWYRLQ